MSGIAIWIGRNGRPVSREDVDRMTRAAAHRAAAAVRQAATSSAVAVHLDGGEESGPGASSPSSDQSLLIVADARIDNRQELAELLGAREIASRGDDTALLLEAYRQWGEAFADRLTGDFAVALWDGRSQRLLLARDLFALRPLVYRVEPSRILAASEVKQILAAGDVPARFFEPQILATLARNAGLPEWTFHEGIQRVPPGHTVVIDGNGTRTHAHRPLEPETIPRDRNELIERLCAGLGASVRARVAAARVPGLLLSGGLDSVSIAGMAGRLRESGQLDRGLVTYGFAFEELEECDELAVSSPIAERYGFRNVPVPADTAWPLAEYPAHGPDLDAPDRLRSHVVMGRTVAVAQRDSVTCLMSGYRGDALQGSQVVDYLGRLSDDGVAAVWSDLAEHGRRAGQTRAALFRSHVLRRLPAAIWPRGRAQGLRALARVSRPGASFPSWLRPDAIRRYDLPGIVLRSARKSTLKGEARRRRHDEILKPGDGRSAEAVERLLARAGIRYADPWAD
ncbi:MAG: asparagine synthase-related protein, partial [Vicinamibacterales bacterium]